MNFKLTKDHDEIRTWIEEHGGRPAIRDKSPNQRGVIDISFGTTDPDHELVSWEEFFDTFDSLDLDFRYDATNEETKEYSYSFINNNEAQLTVDDEDANTLAMPEDDVPIENVIPSAPAQPDADFKGGSLNYGV